MYDPSNPFKHDERLEKLHSINPAYVQYLQEQDNMDVSKFETIIESSEIYSDGLGVGDDNWEFSENFFDWPSLQRISRYVRNTASVSSHFSTDAYFYQMVPVFSWKVIGLIINFASRALAEYTVVTLLELPLLELPFIC